MAFYKHHVFFCTNVREDGSVCCGRGGGTDMREYAKDKAKRMKLAGPGRCRINSAGCMDRCNEGPVMVVYPEGVWYTYLDESDIDEIFEEHLKHGRIVERLKI